MRRLGELCGSQHGVGPYPTTADGVRRIKVGRANKMHQMVFTERQEQINLAQLVSAHDDNLEMRIRGESMVKLCSGLHGGGYPLSRIDDDEQLQAIRRLRTQRPHKLCRLGRDDLTTRP